MRRVIFLLILLSIAVTIPILAEEVRLTTIVPDQTVLRGKKGVVGDTWSNPATTSNDTIPTSSLLVEGGVGIKTKTPARSLHVAGNDGMRLAPSAPPSPAATGDIVIDSSDSNKLKWHDGSSWKTTGGGGGFGNWTSSYSLNTTYTASTDGFVVVAITMAIADEEGVVSGWTPSTTLRMSASIHTILTGQAWYTSFTMPVRKNDTWKVTRSYSASSATILIYWIPLN